MPLKPKDTSVQFRIDAESLELFQARCDHYGETVSQAIRDAIRMMNAHYLKQLSEAASGPSGARQSSVATEVPSAVEKTPVEAIRQPQSLSERRKAQKLAKQAKMAKREGRYMDE
jgi:antitoxin component of RelBE/YafQ-DinJ toxin-antitoxin module